MVGAFCTANQQVLGQVKTEEKSNEITAIPALLDLLHLKGCLVTIDAMGCQTKIAQKIIDKQADYCLAVKENQGRLYKAFERYALEHIDDIFSGGDNTFNSIENNRGREEIRCHRAMEVTDEFLDLSYEWPGMKSLGIAISQTRINGKEPSDLYFRFYISSKSLSAKEFANAIRAHWHIETKLHWVLDVGMREDDCKIWRGDAAENLAGIRKIVINLIKRDKTKKAGVKRKQRLANMSETYMSQLLES